MSGINRAPGDFNLDLTRGLKEGIEGRVVEGRSEFIGPTFQDVWALDALFSYATSGETWEVFSDSPNDTLLGTGARRIIIFSLNNLFADKVDIIELDGTTPVTLTNLNLFRFKRAIVIDVGSTGANEAPITIRVAGGGDVRGCIAFSQTYNRGLNITLGAQFTVPAGKQFVIQGVLPRAGKGEDVVFWPQVRAEGQTAFITAVEWPVFQGSYNVDFTPFFLTLDEKSDFTTIARSSNENTHASISYFGAVVDKIG